MDISNAKVKILPFASFLLPFAFLLSGCAALQVGTNVQQGRMALIYGEPKAALAHFQRAAELDPNYRLNYSILNQGVWTYVGRAYYATGNLPQALKALEKAHSLYGDDYLATLYLGLTLGRDGDQKRGLKEIAAGFKGLGDWLEYIDRYHVDGPFWDPGRQLRSEIEENLKLISGGDFSWPELIARGEKLGKEFEEEIDAAARDKYDKLHRDGDGGGVS